MTFWVWLGRLHLNREQNDSLSFIILEVYLQNWSLISSRGYFPKYSHLAILAKLHGPKGDRINESLLYSTKSLQ